MKKIFALFLSLISFPLFSLEMNLYSGVGSMYTDLVKDLSVENSSELSVSLSESFVHFIFEAYPENSSLGLCYNLSYAPFGSVEFKVWKESDEKNQRKSASSQSGENFAYRYSSESCNADGSYLMTNLFGAVYRCSPVSFMESVVTLGFLATVLELDFANMNSKTVFWGAGASFASSVMFSRLSLRFGFSANYNFPAVKNISYNGKLYCDESCFYSFLPFLCLGLRL